MTTRLQPPGGRAAELCTLGGVGALAGRVGAGWEAVVGLLCASLIPAFTCFLLFSSWIISVSGLQHLLHLLHSKYSTHLELITHQRGVNSCHVVHTDTGRKQCVLDSLRASQGFINTFKAREHFCLWGLLLCLFPVFFFTLNSVTKAKLTQNNKCRKTISTPISPLKYRAKCQAQL